MQDATSRPFGVTVIAILLAIHGVVAGLAAFGVFGPYPAGFLGITLQLVYAVLLFLLAYGMYTFEGWAWLTTLTFQVLNIVFTVILLVQAPGFVAGWIILLLEVAIIGYLLQPSVSSRFTPPQTSR
jgi:hypothetical protein